jgi:hypothetical protein
MRKSEFFCISHAAPGLKWLDDTPDPRYNTRIILLGWYTAMNELCLTVFVMLLFLLNVIVKPR